MTSLPVIVIEDDEFMMQTYCAALDMAGASLHQGFHSLKEAFSMPIDNFSGLFILDYSLPDGNGLEAARRIRELAPDSDIIFVSSSDSPDFRTSCYSAGASAVLVKPVPVGILANVIQGFVKTWGHKADLDFARNAAFSAMRASSSDGETLRFCQTLFTCSDLQSIAKATIDHVSSLGLQAHILIMADASLSTPDCPPQTESIHFALATRPRSEHDTKITSFGRRTLFFFPGCSLFCPDMPLDPIQAGELRDTLAFVAEAAGSKACAEAARQAADIESRQAFKCALLASDTSTVAVSTVIRELSVFRATMADTLFSIGAKESQEEMLMNLIDEAELKIRNALSPISEAFAELKRSRGD